MTLALLSADDFRASVKDGQRPDGMLFRLASGDPEVIADSRSVRFTFSDASIDRAGDLIEQEGWQLDDFNQNPVALFSHMSFDPPIGRAENVGVKGGNLGGDIVFADADTYPFADTIFRLVKGKFLKAVSVGFMPLEWSFSADKNRPFGIDFKKQALLEISVCCVPCNPHALSDAKAQGIDTRPLARWAEKVIDENNSVIVPRSTLEQIFKDARTPHSARTKYRELIERKQDMADWKCGASRDLPVEDSDAWDGGAAEKSIFDWAGGDDFDPAKAHKGFLFYDAAKPKERGSYKDPIAHVVGGELKVPKGAIKAAASRLPQTDVPDAVKKEGEAVLDHYKEKAGIKSKAAGEGSNAAGGGLVGAGNCGRKKDEECGMNNAQECAVHRDASVSCGRDKDEECGMKDPAECATHAPQTKSVQVKAGRRVSAKTRAKLEEALGHHEAAMKSHEAMKSCIKDVLDSNDPNPNEPASDDTLDVEDIDDSLSPEERRLKEARALRKSLNL